MRLILLALMLSAVVGCATQTPTMRPPVTRTLGIAERAQVVEVVCELLEAEKIGIAAKNIGRGIVVTDSFDLPAEYCDCGKNLLGAEYPGKRRGVMRWEISGNRSITITVRFHPQLRISTNNILVKCSSTGVLEDKLLTALEKKLGKTSAP